MNIIISCDRRFVQHACVMVYSLLSNNQEEHFSFFLITSEDDPSIFQPIREVVRPYNADLQVHFVDKSIFQKFKISHHISIATYFRYLIPKIIDVDKALYLDCDIIVNGPIKALYETDLSGNVFAAVSAPNFTHFEKFEIKNRRYFNAGVLLIDVAKWRTLNTVDEMISYTVDKGPDLENWDQDVLNHFFQDKWKELDYVWNYQTIFFRNTFRRSYPMDPVIIHFSTSKKPWEYGDTHPMKNVYFHYLRSTPFRDYKPTVSGFITLIRIWALKQIGYNHYVNPYILTFKRKIFKAIGLKAK